MSYIYFYLYSFFRSSPNKEGASGWAASLSPLLILFNLLAAFNAIEILFHAHFAIPHGKIFFGAIVFCSCLASYWQYELTNHGKEVIAIFSKRKIFKRSALVGGLILIEGLTAPALPVILIYCGG